jgi:hypothetical protein
VDPVEASLLVKEMEADGLTIDEATVVKLLDLHGAYVDGKIREEQAAAAAVRLDKQRAREVQETPPEDAG